jgi:hypothetical protein
MEATRFGRPRQSNVFVGEEMPLHARCGETKMCRKAIGYAVGRGGRGRFFLFPFQERRWLCQ